MKPHLLYLFTRTPLHVGAGSSVGAVDQPIQRERHTGFPIIPGSSIKGVLRDQFQALGKFSKEGIDDLFGRGADTRNRGEGDTGAGGIIAFSEAKLLAFPVRSARGSYALATCPLAMNRYRRDARADLPAPPEVENNTCLPGSSLVIDDKAVVLEEYRFEKKDAFPEAWAAHLSGLLDDAVLKGALHRFVVLSDSDFAHFAINATQVSQHVRIHDETGTAVPGGLFNEETVPSEALFYATMLEIPRRSGEEVDALLTDGRAVLSEEQLIQFGGNGTTGLGYCTARLHSSTNS